MVVGRSFHPKASPEVIAARQECRVRGRMSYVAHWPVVTKRSEVESAGVATVPGAQRRGRFIGVKNEIFGVVENSLSGVFLFASSSST